MVLPLHVCAAAVERPVCCTACADYGEFMFVQAAQLVSWLMAADAADRPTARQV